MVPELHKSESQSIQATYLQANSNTKLKQKLKEMNEPANEISDGS